MDVLWIDFETYSEADITKVGADIYSRHPSTKALMLGWAINHYPPHIWDISSGDPMPEGLETFLLLGYGTIRAYNAPFEMAICQNVLNLKINLHQWQDAQVMAYALSFGGRLKTVLGAIGLENKSAAGDTLLKIFSEPNKPTKKQPHIHRNRETDPILWRDFKMYCRQDVKVLRGLWDWCTQFNPVSDEEWDLWQLDQEINARGLPVDMQLVDAAQDAMNAQKLQVTEDVFNLSKLAKITPGPLKEFFGLDDFQKATKQKYYDTCTDPLKKKVMGLSLQLAQLSSASKWDAFDRRTDKKSNVIRQTLQFIGASRTGRWAGRGVQIHNMKRTTDQQIEDTISIKFGFPCNMDQISGAIRGAICAPEGLRLVVSDLSAIESRLAGWVCSCSRINDIFAQDQDLYKDLATHIFDVPYKDVTKEMRSFAKPAALGAQYRLGAKGLMAYAGGFGVQLNEEEAGLHIRKYRNLYPEVCRFWEILDQTIALFLKGRQTKPVPVGPVIFYTNGPFLCINLPSGRSLRYHKPYYTYRTIPGYESMGPVAQFTYGGMLNQHWVSKGVSLGKWDGGISAHSGGVLENIIQAIARDVLAVWLTRVNRRRLRIVGHVHDEIICLQKESWADEALGILNAEAAKPIDWAPGLLLSANGYTAERYKKG